MELRQAGERVSTTLDEIGDEVKVSWSSDIGGIMAKIAGKASKSSEYSSKAHRAT